jgi:hypothetical protein
MDKKQENTNQLLELIKQNPELEILPMVSTECVPSDEFGYWGAAWGRSEVDEYLVIGERIYFKSIDFDEVVDLQFDDSEGDEEHATIKAEQLGWIKAIVVHIETP